MNWKARLRNKAFWLSFSALVVLIAKTFKLFEVPEDWETTVNTALSLLVAMGVLMDPTTPGITDKEE
ncbi:Bacteriophage holin [Caloramator mitchellensis]|uniref:Bacteriophage holin n=1 Tax=Caloramator mitchellensis TaxID=908809 RepID=A0A0R3JRH7_CALMK|nr:phage holin [Caloramator mitchellensis]KRQ86070.1 Bacteriophage holin [Caloramator mitchellensis]